MTATQLALGDCDPAWDDLDRLADLGAEELHDPIDQPWRDLRGQRITKRQYHRMQTVPVQGDVL
ncbi:hypothetical protein ABZT16_11420 [Streptomyces flaveolus]|uniref:hypothetical protein n=1 Tax=Streptomyces flaveolus TaxID=67297 RepID=UPI0033BEB497